MQIAGDDNIDSGNVVVTEVASMEAFDFTQNPQYSAIYLRWCIGYLKRPEQIKFLKKAAKALQNEPINYTRTKGPPNYIILLDNIIDNPKKNQVIEVYGQKVESDGYYTQLFHDANLQIQTSQRKSLHSDYLAIKMWALY